MHSYAYERLSAQDNLFLLTESPETPMHIGAVLVLESGKMRTEQGGVDIERYKQAIEGVLHRIPRYRQKLRALPLEDVPVWVDDPHFSLDYHIRHTSLPRPGSIAQLKELSSRIIARPLDRARPLWELWVVEGLDAGNQFAVISKTHHCMIDGAAGADLATILMSADPDAEIQKPDRYIPRPQPSRAELLFDEVKRGLRVPFDAFSAANEFVGDLARHPSETLDTWRERIAAVGELTRSVLTPCSDTPINGPIGPHRSFDWLTMPLDDVKDVKNVLGCTVNDLVLATVAGGVRRYMEHRRVDPAGLDFRVMAPVDIRRDGDRGKMGNHVSSWVVDLPVGEPDPTTRLTAVCETTRERKASHAALGLELIMGVTQWLPSSLIGLAANAATVPVNMVVTNVPGPQFPLYMLGAELLGVYPLVPLVPGGGLGIALFSYDGRLCWGFNADPKLVPDLETLVLHVRDAFEEFRGLAVRQSLKPKRRRVSEAPTTEEAEALAELVQAHGPDSTEDAAHDEPSPSELLEAMADTETASVA